MFDEFDNRFYRSAELSVTFRYMATSIACGWAGKVRPKRAEIQKKYSVAVQQIDRRTDILTNQQTNGPTKHGIESRSK